MQSQLMRLEVHPESNNEGKCEEIIDYILSFTFHMASDSNMRHKLRNECRRILLFFLEIDTDNSKISITRVSPTKQWKRIDLIVDVELIKNGIVENHCILIETKYFSKLENNLSEYLDKATKFKFPVKPEKKRDMHYWVFHCRSDNDAIDYKNVLPDSFSIINKQFFESNGINETESEIFNEFWINNWQTNSFEEIV